MRTIISGAAVLLAAALCVGQADAFSRGNRAGGSTSHSAGETSHDNRWGGSSEHAAGQGTEHTNAYGGSTAHAYGGGTEHTNTYGGSTAHAEGGGTEHTNVYCGTTRSPPAIPPIRPIPSTIRPSQCRTTRRAATVAPQRLGR
jgi:hypothetical protein